MPGWRCGCLRAGARRLRWPLLVAALLPLPAMGFMAQNGMTARQVAPTEIAVDYRARRDDVDYWCAAGEFAQHALGLPGNTRLWRASPKPREAGSGILFTLDANRRAEGAGLSQFGSGNRDGSMTVGTAIGSHCRVDIPPWLD